jgi:protein TonB
MAGDHLPGDIMQDRRVSPLAAFTLSAALAACSEPRAYPTEPAGAAPSGYDHVLARQLPLTAGATGAGSYASIDRYKEALARHILLHNSAHTFSGPLPPMLPAIVVLRMSVDQAGRVSELYVQRSIDDVASRIALASVERSQRLPLPHNLLTRNGAKLTFSETFLFNKDYRFQIRSLAQPQPPVD